MQQKRIEERFEEFKKDLEDLRSYVEEFLAFLPLPVVNVNPLGFILDANRAFLDLIRKTDEEVLGGSVEDYFEEKERFLDFQKKVLEKGEEIRGRELTLLSGERKIPVSVYLSPRKDKKGNIIGYFLGIYDITDFKKLQQSLEERVRERTKDLQEKIEELEKTNKLMIGRELRMMELKEKIKKLEEELRRLKKKEFV